MLAVDLLQMGHAMLDAPAAERKGLADDALSLKRQTLRQKQARLGDAHPECLQEQEHLASLLKRADRYAESVEEYEKLMPRLEAMLGGAPGQPRMSPAPTPAVLQQVGELNEEFQRVEPNAPLHAGPQQQAKTMFAMSQDNFGIGEDTTSHLPEVHYRHPRTCCGADSRYPHAVAVDSLARTACTQR
jgi:hypothetical protein